MTRKINFPDLLAPGENPHGFRAIEPNGVGHDIPDDFYRQPNWGPGTDGPRWNPEPEPSVFMAVPVKTRRRK